MKPLAVASKTPDHRSIGGIDGHLAHFAIAAGKRFRSRPRARCCAQRMAASWCGAAVTNSRLIYRLTVLARDGKVRQVTIDATNGTVIGGL